MPFSGELVHGAFLHWLDAAAPEVASWLHDGNKRRLFTCSSLRFNRPAHALLKAEREHIHLPLDPQETYSVRLTLLLGELLPLFHQALTQFDVSRLGADTPPFLHLGRQHFLLEEVIVTNDDPASWTGWTSLADLVEQAKATRLGRDATLTLEFASLTTFNRGSKKMGYGPYPLLLPQPEFVFRNLAKRWEDIAPPELVGFVESERLERYLAEDGIIIVDYDLKPHYLRFSTHQQRGFLGTCTYQLRGPIETPTEEHSLTMRQQVALLAHLAFYSGIGYKTAMGLGRARLRI